MVRGSDGIFDALSSQELVGFLWPKSTTFKSKLVESYCEFLTFTFARGECEQAGRDMREVNIKGSALKGRRNI